MPKELSTGFKAGIRSPLLRFYLGIVLVVLLLFFSRVMDSAAVL